MKTGRNEQGQKQETKAPWSSGFKTPPFHNATGVQIPLVTKKFICRCGSIFANKDCVHDGNIRRTNAPINVRLMFSSYRRLHRERENEVFRRRHAIKIRPMRLQLAKRLICNQQVNRSSPFIGFRMRTCKLS